MTRRTRAQIRAEELVALENAEVARKEFNRAQARATVRQLLAMKRRIGVALADACGADTAEALDALARVLSDRAVIEVIAERASLTRSTAVGRSHRSSASGMTQDSDAEREWFALSSGIQGRYERGDDDD